MKSNNKYYFLKGLLLLQTFGVLAYTVIAIKNDGANVFLRAQEFVQSLTWIGQFSLDFSCYLTLSALWIAWRNKYSGRAVAFAIAALILGIIVFAPYVLYLLAREKGDLKRVLIGDHA